MVNRRGNNRNMTVLLLSIVAGLFLVYLLAVWNEKAGDTPNEPISQGATEVVGMTPTGGGLPSQAEGNTPVPTQTIQPQGELELHFLNVGEGAAVLFLWNGEAMLIDGGGRSTSSYVVSYLERRGVERLSLMVATHYDSDHISGMIGAMKVYGADAVWGPDYVADTKIYRSFASAVSESGQEIVHPVAGTKWTCAGLTLEILSVGDGEAVENDRSLMLRVRYAGKSILITGDATAVRERALIAEGGDLNCDIYYVGHHGSNSSSCEEFLMAMKPTVAVISVGENEYGHPHEQLLERLEACGASVYRTDTGKEIVAVFAEGKDVVIQTNE